MQRDLAGRGPELGVLLQQLLHHLLEQRRVVAPDGLELAAHDLVHQGGQVRSLEEGARERLPSGLGPRAAANDFLGVENGAEFCNAELVEKISSAVAVATYLDKATPMV